MTRMRGIMNGLALLSASAPAAAAEPWTFETRATGAAADAVVVEFSAAGVPQAASLVLPGTQGRSLAAVGENLLPLFSARAFGVEERVTVTSGDDGLTITCSAGERPAGAVLTSASTYLPRAMAGALRVDGRGSGGLRASLGEAEADVPYNARTLASGRTMLPLDTLRYGGAGQALAILCPARKGSFTITGLRIEPKSVTGRRPSGTWLWDPAIWSSSADQVTALAARQRIDELALQFHVAGSAVSEAERIGGAVQAIAGRGRTVIAVEGDPDMISPEGLEHAVRRASALKAFNAGLPATRRIGLLELDIEPYSRPAYRLNPAGVWRDWALAVNRIAQAWGGKVLVDVPFWMLSAEGGEAAVEAVRPALAGVVVMAYRTEAAELPGLVEPWLAWGAARDVPVRIALEQGAVEPELHRTYRPADRGEVTLRQADGRARISLHAAPVAGTAQVPAYRFSHETRVEPTRISFMGDDAKRERVAGEILPFLQSWRSFAGLRIHGLWDGAITAESAAR